MKVIDQSKIKQEIMERYLNVMPMQMKQALYEVLQIDAGSYLLTYMLENIHHWYVAAYEGLYREKPESIDIATLTMEMIQYLAENFKPETVQDENLETEQ